MTGEIYIELNKVSKYYKKLKAVDDLSIQVYQGDIYGFLGPNGAGKSTCIRMLLSLIKPSSGEIRLFGKDLAFNRYQTLSRIGALIEKPDFYKYLTARKNLEILGKLTRVEKLEKKIEETLELVGLRDRADSKLKTYSQGMRQRLGIAQTLLHDPDMIILDEPANGLDPQGQKEMRQLIRSINAEKGITVLISSHILAEIEQISNRMVIINKGRNVIEGEVNELLNREEMKVSFFLDDLQQALKHIAESRWEKLLVDKNRDKIVFSLDQEQIPELTHFLVSHHIQIYEIRPLRSLEEYFLKITSS